MDIKISQLDQGNAADSGPNDSFPFVDAADGSTKRMLLSDLQNLPGFPSSGVRKFTTSGTFVVPAGVTELLLTGCGGAGGGQGGGAGGAGQGFGFAGTGGSAGASTFNGSLSVAVVPGQSYAITVGAGGAGGVGAPPAGAGGAEVPPVDGDAGGDTTFIGSGVLVSFPGMRETSAFVAGSGTGLLGIVGGAGSAPGSGPGLGASGINPPYTPFGVPQAAGGQPGGDSFDAAQFGGGGGGSPGPGNISTPAVTGSTGGNSYASLNGDGLPGIAGQAVPAGSGLGGYGGGGGGCGWGDASALGGAGGDGSKGADGQLTISW